MKDERCDIEDQILVMDAQDGDAGAMEKLVSRWQRRLRQHAFRLTDDAQAAWDVTQQGWLGIIKGLRKLHNPANFRAWAYGITTNKSIDWIRKTQTARHISIEEIQERQLKDKYDTGVKELLEKLDTRKKAVLILYYLEQLDVSEISDALNIPKGTVKSRLYNAGKELKELWQQHYK